MNTTSQPQAPLDDSQIAINVLTRQRNELADQLVAVTVDATRATHQVSTLAEQNALLQSALDDANRSLDATKTALATAQAMLSEAQVRRDATEAMPAEALDEPSGEFAR